MTIFFVNPEESEKHRVELGDLSWDIEKVQQYVKIGAPKTLKAKFRCDELPFPPEVMEQITENQISNLQKLFDLPDADRYYHWCDVYGRINWLYLMQDSTGTNERRTLKTVPYNDMPEIFCLLAFSRLLDHDKSRELDDRRSGKFWKLNDRAKNEAQALEKAVGALLKKIVRIEKGYGSRGHLYLPKVVNWCREQGFADLLVDLKAVTVEDREEGQQLFEDMYELSRKYTPSNNPEFTSSYIYAAFDRIACIFRDQKRRKARDVKNARELYRSWGIAIDEEAERRALSRKKV